jgi:protocatechuate 3,4-dioxygenase beta subunit
LVDEIAHKHINESGETPTSSTILGPFWSPHSPFRDLGDTIIRNPHPDGQTTLMHGVVMDLDTKKGIPNAVIDIWQASANGKYDFQDPENQEPNNLRGKFTTNEKGEYWYYCYKPTAYSLPTDGMLNPKDLVRRSLTHNRRRWPTLQDSRPPPLPPRAHPSHGFSRELQATHHTIIPPR